MKKIQLFVHTQRRGKLLWKRGGGATLKFALFYKYAYAIKWIRILMWNTFALLDVFLCLIKWPCLRKKTHYFIIIPPTNTIWGSILILPCLSVCPSACLSVCLSVNFSYFRLLKNHWANFNQTWHKASLGKRGYKGPFPFLRGDNYEIAKNTLTKLKNLLLQNH